MNTQATSVGNGNNGHTRFPHVKPGRSNQFLVNAWQPLLLFILFTLAITLASYAVFQHYKEHIKIDSQGDLGGIAELKTRQITNWMSERRGDAQVVAEDTLFVTAVDHWLKQGGTTGETSVQLTERLASLQQAFAAYGYISVSLFDEQAMLRLSSAADEAPIQGVEKVRLLESMRTGQITISDIHREKINSGERIEIELRAPLSLVKNGKTRIVGAILFRIDPSRFLFPLIQRWPTPSPSAETLLVRRDGDEVVFLNELRHRKNTALAMRLPMNKSGLPAAMAAMGQEGLVEGVDYRDVPVVGVLSKVAGTSWFMVSKIDQAEIYAPINQLANWLVVMMLSLIGAGGGIAIFWQQKERRQYQSELQHQSLTRHLDYLTKYANDIILLLDSTGKIVDFNDRALEAYCYTAEIFSTLNISNLQAIDFTPRFSDRLEEINRTESLRFESTHVRRNGENFPIEASVRLVDTIGERFHQAIIRDITERKKAESELVIQKNFMRQIIDSDPNLIFVKDAEGRFLLANAAMAKSYGQTTENIIGKYNWELADNWALDDHQEHLAEYDRGHREVIEKRQEQVALETAYLADDKHHVFQTIRKPLVQDDGPVSVLTIAMDITELKETEQRLQINNRALRLLSACNMALVHIAEEGQLLSEICKLIVEAGGYRMAWIGFAEHDPEKNVRPVARYGSDEGYLDSANISWADTERGRGPIGIAIRTGVTQINQNFLTNPLLTLWREAALARGYQSSIALPLISGTQTFGTLSIYSAAPESFNTDEVTLLKELADNLAWGVTALRTRTEHEQAVEKLRKSEEHFRFLTENATDMIYLMAMPDGRYDYVSPSSTHLTGYTPEEFYNSPRLMKTLVHPDWRAYCEEQWEKFLVGEVAAHFEFQIIHKSGATRWMHQRNAPLRFGEGKETLIAIQGVITDITERKLAEEVLKFKNILLSTEQEVSLDGILAVDSDGKIISFNQQFVKMWDISAEIIESGSDERALQSVLDKLIDPELFLEKVHYLYEHTQETSHDEIFLHDGRVIDRYTAPMKGPDGILYGRIWYFRDITERKQAEQMESRLRHLLNSTQDMIFIFEPDSLRFVYMNKGAIDSIGYSNEELLLMTPPDIKPLIPEPEFRKLIAPLIAGEQNLLRFETTHRRKDGTEFPVEIQLQLVQEQEQEQEQDRKSLFVAIVRDITERKSAEQELQRQKIFMWQVIDTDPSQIFVKDANGNFLLANQSAAAAHGLTPNEMIGKSFAEISSSPEEVAGYLEADRKVIEEGREVSLIEPYMLPNGEQRWFLTVKKRLVMPDGKLSMLGIAVDITLQKRSEIKLARSYRKLQQLYLHLENIKAEERARIALNLHDEMGAMLAATKMSVAWIASKLPAGTPQLAAEVAHLTTLVTAGIQTMRQVVTQLNPGRLDDVGLAAAIQDYVKKFQQYTGIECLFILPNEELVLDTNQSATIFRILQESLNNVVKHAQASEVHIILKKRGKSLLLTVEDNGIGLNLNEHKEQSFGLLGIRERALIVGGKARIKSQPGKGTQVLISIPLSTGNNPLDTV